MIAPGLKEHFAKLLSPTNTRIYAFDGETRKVKGILPVTFGLGGREVRIDFKAVETITQEVLLGANFEIAYDMFVRLGLGIWHISDSEQWYRFDNVKERPKNSPAINEKVTSRTEVLSLAVKEETRVGEIDDWVCCFTYESENERIDKSNGILRGVKEEENAWEMYECMCMCIRNKNVSKLEKLYEKLYMCYVILVFSVYRCKKLSNMRSRAWKRPKTLPPTTGGIGNGPGPENARKTGLCQAAENKKS